MRRPGGSRDLVVVAVAAALMLLVAGATAVIAPPDEGLGLRGSSLSSGAAGGKAGFLLLRRLGYVVQRTFDPMVSLEAEPGDRRAGADGAAAAAVGSRRRRR